MTTNSPTPPSLTLAERIAKASRDCGGFAADKKNTEQGYAYISADLVLERGGTALANIGVAVIPSVTETEIRAIDRPNKSPRLDARVVFSMLVSDGVTELVCPWVGFGSDYSVPDKAIYKAITSGHKYFLMKLLNIGVGNEDGEHESEPTRAQTPALGEVPDQESPLPPSGNLWKRYYELERAAKAAGIEPDQVSNDVSTEELKVIGKALRAAIDAKKQAPTA